MELTLMSTSVGQPPTFIVGAPRSGTSLLAAMMNAHPILSCGNETHFFERLTDAMELFLTDARHWPGRAASYMHNLQHMGHSIFDLYRVDPSDYVTRLSNSRRAASAILGCFMEAHLNRTRKVRWVEKTPDHLRRFKIIRRCFPNSRVVCMFRDPRDVALSLLSVPWGTPTFKDGLILWYSFYKYYLAFMRDADNVLVIRYEDLVQQPIDTARSVCSFLAEPFDEGMLKTSDSAIDVGSSLEPYKARTSMPVDMTRVFVWKNRLESREVALCDQLLHDCLIDLNYPSPDIAGDPDTSFHPRERLRITSGNLWNI
jgi:hypothetical protein